MTYFSLHGSPNFGGSLLILLVRSLRPFVLLVMKMHMEKHLWNVIDRWRPKHLKRNLCQFYFLYQESRMDSPGIEPCLRGDRPAPLKMKINVSYTKVHFAPQVVYTLHMYCEKQWDYSVLYGRVIRACLEIRKIQRTTLCRQNVEYIYVKPRGT